MLHDISRDIAGAEREKKMDTIRAINIPEKFSSLIGGAKAEDSADNQAGWAEIKDTVSRSIDDWQHQGKKYGTLTAAAAGSVIIPVALASAVPALSIVFLGPVGMLSALTLVALEEKNIGIGKTLGTAAGTALGAGIGLLKCAKERISPSAPHSGNEKVTLLKRAPQGKAPKESLLPSILHKAEKTLLGHVPARTNAVERCESIGTFASGMVMSAMGPALAAGLLGGPAAIMLGTVVGPLLGFVAGSFEESTLGAGRFAGEIAGHIAGKAGSILHKGGSSAGAAAWKVSEKETKRAGSNPEKADSVLGKIKKFAGDQFMALNSVISEPIMGLLFDATGLLNLLLREKPVQTMEFTDRPFPSVNRERLVNDFIKLAGINAQYQQEDTVAKALCARFDKLGISHRTDAAGNLMATIPATKGLEDSPTILMSSHMDTVSATSEKAIINDGRKIRTNEKCILGGDDRAGIAEIMEGLETVMEKGMAHPEIKLLFTMGEEVGLKGSVALKPEDISTRPTLGYVVDSTDKSSLYLTNDSVIIVPESIKYNYSQEDPLVQVALRSMADAGIEPHPVHGPILAGAGTDANTPALNTGNIRSIAIGTGVSDEHTPLENVKIDDLEQVARTVVGILTNSGDLKVDDNKKISPRMALTAA
jgi:putative aminopeptidase FrvX